MIGLVALAYHRVLFWGETFVERDALRFALPSREFLAHALRAGRVPEWLDAVGLGAAFAANPVHEVLAPLGWTLALVPGALGSDLYNLLHVLIGGLGAAALARRLGAGTAGSVVAGAALTLGGYVTSMVPNNLAPALAWTPWVAWAADRLAGCFAAGQGSPGLPPDAPRSAPAKAPRPNTPPRAAPLSSPAAASAPRLRGRRLAAGAVLAAALALQLLAGEPGSVLIAGLAALIVLMARAGAGAAGGLGGSSGTGASKIGAGGGAGGGGSSGAGGTGGAGGPGGTGGTGGQRLRALGALALAGAGALALAAVALLPAVLLLQGSARGAGLDQGGMEWSLLPARLVETIWPAAFGSQRVDGWLAGLVLRDGPGDPCWSYSLFLGFPVLLCAWAGARQRPVRRLLWASAVFLLLAVGPLLPAYSLLRGVFPPLRWVNFPEKFVYGALLLWCAAAGVGFSRLAALGASRRLRAAAWTGAALLGLAVAALALARAGAAATLARRAAAWGVLVNVDAGLAAALAGGGVAAGAAGLFALALTLGMQRPPGARSAGGVRTAGAALGMALLATLAPLAWAAATTTPLAHRSVIAATPAVLRGLAPAPAGTLPAAAAPGVPRAGAPEDASPGRVAARMPTAGVAPAAGSSEAPRPRLFRLEPRRENGPFHGGDDIARDYHESLDTNIASRFGVDVLPGFEPGQSTRYLRFGREVFPRMSPVAFTRLLGVNWLVVRDPESLGLPFPVVATGAGGSALLAAAPVRPRAFVAPRWRAAATPEQALAALADPGRDDDPAAIVLALAGPVADPAGARPGGITAEPAAAPAAQQARAAAPLSPCRARQRRPEEVSLDCDSPAGGYAVLLDEWAPGWSATADGRPVPILLADGLFRAVAVGPGPHRIAFRYRTPGLRAGAAVSLLAWLAAGAWLLAGPARRRRQAREAA
ncbi:MAG: YfhO family protein [Acidobacteria bacterium]|nr:YfhO family protein [Acidobacteriota bacterium]